MILVVGAGFSGAVIARELAEKGYQIRVIESREHVAGNCYTKKDPETKIMEHIYGPHIFHTDDIEIWKYLNKFTEMMPYIHQVKATADNRIFSLPINLHTINQFFNKTMGPIEAKCFIENKTQPIKNSFVDFESKAISLIGVDLYKCFFKHYTEKQWGISANQINGKIINRLPLRYNYDDNYYSHKYQGIPKYGYTAIVDNILKHENIDIRLGVDFDHNMKDDFSHIFYSGTLDGYYNYEYGRLPYRTLKFNRFVAKGDFQGCAVMNYCDKLKPFTRITEFKYFTPWETFENTIYIEECSKDCGANDIPYYPISLVKNPPILSKYKTLALNDIKTTFIGRLGTYRYLDMDVTIRESLNIANEFVNKTSNTYFFKKEAVIQND